MAIQIKNFPLRIDDDDPLLQRVENRLKKSFSLLSRCR